MTSYKFQCGCLEKSNAGTRKFLESIVEGRRATDRYLVLTRLGADDRGRCRCRSRMDTDRWRAQPQSPAYHHCAVAGCCGVSLRGRSAPALRRPEPDQA